MSAEWDHASILKVSVLSSGIKEEYRERPTIRAEGGHSKSKSQNFIHIPLSQTVMPIFSDQACFGKQQSLIVNCLETILLKE